MAVTRGFCKHWRHGHVYYVLGIGASHSNADEGKPRPRWVLYESTQSCEDDVTRMRPEDEFTQWVHADASTLPVDYDDSGTREAEIRACGYVRRFERVEAGA